MTTMDAIRLGIPRWMVLAMPEDVAQIAALAELEYRTPSQQRVARDYYLHELRRTQWERQPRKPTRRPPALRPSKFAGGYRTSSAAHRDARLKVNVEQRRAIARKGQQQWQSNRKTVEVSSRVS